MPDKYFCHVMSEGVSFNQSWLVVIILFIFEQARPHPVADLRGQFFSTQKATESQKYVINIDLSIHLKVAGELLATDPLHSTEEVQRRMDAMSDFLQKRDEKADVTMTDAVAGVFLFQSLNHLGRIIDGDGQSVPSFAEKGAGPTTVIPFAKSGEMAQFQTPLTVDQTLLQMDSRRLVSPFQHLLNLGQKSHVMTSPVGGSLR